MADYGRITTKDGKNYFYDDKTKLLGKEVKLKFGDTGLDKDGNRNMWDGAKWVPIVEVSYKELKERLKKKFDEAKKIIDSNKPQQNWFQNAKANTAKRNAETIAYELFMEFRKKELAKPEEGDGTGKSILKQEPIDYTRFNPNIGVSDETEPEQEKLERKEKEIVKKYIKLNGKEAWNKVLKGKENVERSKDLQKAAGKLADTGFGLMLGTTIAPYVLPWAVKQIPWMTADYGINKGLDYVAENSPALAPIANNKWVRTIGSAFGMSSGNFLTTALRTGVKSAAKLAPASFLRDQILFNSGTAGTSALGDNFGGNLLGFTLGSLATRKYPGINSLEKFTKDFKFLEKGKSFIPKLKYNHRFVYNTLTSAGSSIPLAIATELGEKGSDLISQHVDPEVGEWSDKFLNAYLLHHAGKVLGAVDRGFDAFKANNAILVGTTSKPRPTAKTVLYNLLNAEPSGSIKHDVIKNRKTLIGNLKRNIKHSYHFAINSPDLLLYLLNYVDNLNPVDRFMPGRKRGFLLGEGTRTDNGKGTTTLTESPTALLVYNSPFYRIIANNVSAEQGEHYDTGEVATIKTENLPSTLLKFIKENYPTIIGKDESIPVFRVRGNISLDESNREHINKEILRLRSINPEFSEEEARKFLEDRLVRERMKDDNWDLFWNSPAEDTMMIGATGPMTLGENIHNNGGRSIVNTAGHNIYCKKINGKWYAVGFDFTKFLADNYDAAHVSGTSNAAIKDKSKPKQGIRLKLGEKVMRLITPQLLNSIDNGVMIHTTEVTPLSEHDLKKLFNTRNNVRLASYQIKKYKELIHKARISKKGFYKETLTLKDNADELDLTKLTPAEQLFIKKFESDQNAGAYKFSGSQIKLLNILGNNKRKRRDLLKLAEEARSYGLLSEDGYVIVKANSNATLTRKEKEKYREIIMASKEKGTLTTSDRRKYFRRIYRVDKNLDYLFTKPGDFKKLLTAKELEQLNIEELKKSIERRPYLMEDIKAYSPRLYEQLSLKLKEGKVESKLDKLKLFKKGGIVLLPKKLTWEEYQKQNRNDKRKVLEKR